MRDSGGRMDASVLTCFRGVSHQADVIRAPVRQKRAYSHKTGGSGGEAAGGSIIVGTYPPGSGGGKYPRSFPRHLGRSGPVTET